MPKNVGDLGKFFVDKCFIKLPKVQKIAQSGHTVTMPQLIRHPCGTNLPTFEYVTWSDSSPEERRHSFHVLCQWRNYFRVPRWPLLAALNTKNIFISHPGLFFAYFRSFQANNTNFTTNQCEKMSKCPSSIWRQDSNPWPFERESPPITTRPGLRPWVIKLYGYN